MLFLCLFVINLSCKTVGATTSANLSYQINDKPTVGEVFEFSIEIQDVTDLYGISLDFEYDQQLMEVLEVNKGTIFDQTNSKVLINEIQDNRVSLLITLLGQGQNLASSGELLRLKVKAINAGDVTINRVQSLNDLQSNSLLLKLSNSKGEKINGVGVNTISFTQIEDSNNGNNNAPIVFPDIEEGKWYTSHIQEFVSLGFVKGYSDGTFKPQNPITRAEFVKIVNKAFDLSSQFTPVTDLPFTDLDSEWKKDELKLALAAGYITPATEFRHNDPINRQEAAKIVGYLLGSKIQAGLSLDFTDASDIAPWAQDYVAGLVQVGVLSKNETFRPKDPITRAEAVKMLNIARGL